MKLSRLFWIGLTFVFISIIFVFGLLYIQDISIRKSNYIFTVIFENVQGLHMGDEVDMLGKKIGKVSQTRIKGQKIAVELSIDKAFAFNIPVDSKIEVKSEGLIGSKFISITPGYNREDFILPGATVEGLREFGFTELTPDIVPMTHDLSAFARQLRATLGDQEKDNIRIAIKNIESITTGLDNFIQNNQSFISDEDKVNFQLTLQNLKVFTTELNNGINKEIIKLDHILENVKNVTDKSDEINIIINELLESSKLISSSTKKLDHIFTKLENGEGTLGKLVSDETLHDNMNNFVNDIRALIQDFKDNPTKYMKAYWKGKK